MEVTVLDTNLNSIAIIDAYKSFIWTDRYDEYGDFEIYIPINKIDFSYIRKGFYLWNSNSEHIMIIETINIQSDIEEGAYCVVSGRSLESILDRRIVWNKKVFLMDTKTLERPSLQNGIETLLKENIIEPVEVRKIPNFVFKKSEDEKITSLTFEGEYLGDDLYSVISKLCKENEIGFKITLNDDLQFVFELYAGVDRSYGTEDEPQFANPYVIFSPDYDNVFNTNYLDSDEKWKNVTLVVGESEYDEDGNEVSRISYEHGYGVGLERREIFTNATSLSMEDEYGGVISPDRYKALLKQKGIDTLIDNTSITAFEGEVDPNILFKYGEDFFIGDIVQITNEYGQEGRAYISEFIMSHDESGTAMYPTFNTIQKGVYET